jgi:replicative DNA helicase
MSELASLRDLPTERQILGYVLEFNLWAAFDACGVLESDFSHPQHQQIYAAAAEVHDAGGVAELPAVTLRLEQKGQLEDVGSSYLGQLVSGVARPAPTTIPALATRLQDLSAARRAFYAAEKVQRELQSSGGTADGALLRHLDAVQAIVEQQRTPQAAPWLDVEGQLTAHTRDAALSLGQRVFFGLPALDESLDGVRAGEVCGFLGRPGIGKTVVLSHVSRAVTEFAGHVFFSLEMPAAQIVGRLKQMVYGLGRHELERKSRANELDPEPYRQAFRNLVIVDTPGLSVAEMGRRLRRIANGPLKDRPIALVTIDHLGLVGGDRGLSTYDRVSTQSRDIKELAKRHACAVLLAVQVSREAGGDGSRELGLGSARDSGVVEEAMDYMVGIRRLDRSLTLTPAQREPYRDVIFSKVIKNRHGDPGLQEIAYRFNPVGLELREDRSLRAEENDVARIAAARSGGRR